MSNSAFEPLAAQYLQHGKMWMVVYKIQNPQVQEGFEKILKESVAWWNQIPYTWLVVSAVSAHDLVERVKPFLAGPDRIMIFEVHPELGTHSGWLHTDTWDWITYPLAPKPEPTT